MFLKAAALLFLAFVAAAHGVEIRVATFNIGAHLVVPPSGPAYFDYGVGAPGTPDHDTVREILDRIDADVVALEEIHTADITAGHVSALASSLGYAHVFLSTTSTAFDTSLRVIVLSRFPFLTTTSVASPAGARDLTRLIPAVKVDVPGTTRDPVLIAAHLKSGSEASDLFQRTVEMRRLTNHLSALGLTMDDNFLIMGDFNLSNSDRTFTELPDSGLPGSFDLGADIVFPINYFTNPTSYFSSPGITRILPRQLDDSTVTFPSSGSTIDLFMVSPIIGSRPLHTEIYNSALDTSNASGLPKAGSPLPAGTSTTASDHYAVFGDIELDTAPPYTFNAPGETVSETFTGFPGTYDPYPWVATGGTWQEVDSGGSTAPGFRAYGSAGDPSLGFLPGAGGGSGTAAFVNHSSTTLTALQISYTAEQWRSASGGTADTLSAELLVNGVPSPLPALTFQAATNLPGGAITGGVSTPKSMVVSGLAVPPGETFQLRFTFTPGASEGLPPAEFFINEFDYDDFSTDTGEFMEIVAGPGFTGSLANVSVVLYRANGTVYDTQALSTFTAGAVTSSGHHFYSKLMPGGIQNGPSQGFALVVNGTVTQFISYEGQLTATAGAANGKTSTDIGVSQTGGEPEGESALGLTGTGGTSSNFSWIKLTDVPYSPGQPNSGQTFVVPTLPPQGIAIDDLAVTFLYRYDSDGDGYSDADELVFGTDPEDAESRFSMSFSYASPTAGKVELEFPTVTGRSYTVEKSVDLDDWDFVKTYPGTGSTHVVVLPVNPLEPECFYRIRVTLP